MKKIISMLIIMILFSTVAYATPNKTYEEYYQAALFPAKEINVTQLAFESFSHANQNAIDIIFSGRALAPFDAKVTFVDKSWGYVVLQSLEPVHWANGTIDYMTVGFMHDSNIADIKVGQTLSQGQAFYDMGGQGEKNGKYISNAYGSHVHLTVFKGKKNVKSSSGNGDSFAFNAFFIGSGTKIKNAGKLESANKITKNGAPKNYSGKWKNVSYITRCGRVKTDLQVTVTKKTSIKSLPCSTKTNDSSVTISTIEPSDKKFTILRVIAVWRNTEGNWWYELDGSGDRRFIYSGDVMPSGIPSNYYVVNNVLFKGGKKVGK